MDEEQLPLAATVVLVRDGAEAPEVLLLERPGRGSFPGAWVFPGGAVDPEDGSDDDAPRRAGAREVAEETGLRVDVDALVPLSRWDPPRDVPKRMRTSFFLAPAPEGEIVLPEAEAVAHRWTTPAQALADHGTGSLILVPPTWVTLHHLREDPTAASALERVAASSPTVFRTRWLKTPAGVVSLWPGDAGWETEDPQVPGARHRLEMFELPWVYRRS